MREKASELRKYLSQYPKRNKDNVIESEHEVRTAIRELSDVLKNELQDKGRSLFYDALKLNFWGLIPVPDIQKIRAWITFKRSKKYITVLSEFAKYAASDRIDQYYYERLVKNTSK
jgi:hypothetical protein